MEKVLIFAISITLVFCVFKFIEMKYIEDDMKPLKYFVRDAIMVFASSFVVCYLLLHHIYIFILLSYLVLLCHLNTDILDIQ
jgi:hypothetical protein